MARSEKLENNCFVLIRRIRCRGTSIHAPYGKSLMIAQSSAKLIGSSNTRDPNSSDTRTSAITAANRIASDAAREAPSDRKSDEMAKRASPETGTQQTSGNRKKQHSRYRGGPDSQANAVGVSELPLSCDLGRTTHKSCRDASVSSDPQSRI